MTTSHPTKSAPAPSVTYTELPDFDTVEQRIYAGCRRFISGDMLEPIHDLIREAIDADRASRGRAPAPAAVAGPSDRIPIEDSIAWQETGTGVERNAVMVSGRTWYRDDHPLLAPTTQAAPLPAAPASQDAKDALVAALIECDRQTESMRIWVAGPSTSATCRRTVRRC